MPDLARRAVCAAVGAAVAHVRAGDAGADGDEPDPLGPAPRAQSRFGERATTHVVGEHRRQPQAGNHQITQRYVPEADVCRPHRDSGRVVDHSGRHETDGPRIEPLEACRVSEAGRDLDDRVSDGARSAIGAGQMALRVPDGPVGRVDQGALQPGAANVDRDDDVGHR